MRAPRIKPSRPTVRFWLNYLVLACLLPAAAVATFLIMRSYTHERASLERDIVATARALVQAVDAELAGIQSAQTATLGSPTAAKPRVMELLNLVVTSLSSILAGLVPTACRL